MLRVEAPANFVLTLQSVPPFLVENILALALVVLLAVPLIAHIQLLLDNTTMGASTRRKYHSDHRREHANRTVVMHYPAPVKLDSSSNSDLNIQLTSIRTTCSTPTVMRSVENLKHQSIKENPDNQLEEQYKQILRKMFLKKQKTCLPLKRSSSFLATNGQLPIVDISAFDYDSYRHKLIEMSLKRQYGDRQAPGNVVLNSIHLNSVGSQSGIQLSEKYSHSLFDFIEEYYDATKAMSKKEKEYLHPLDHFLVKGVEKPKTANTGTETKESMTDLDQVPEMVAFRDESPTPAAPFLTSVGKRRVLEAGKHPSKLTIRSRTSSSMPRTPPQTSPTAKPSATSTRKSSAISTTQQLFNRAENLNPTENRHSSALIVPSDKPQERKRVLPTPRTSRSRTPHGAVSTRISQVDKTPKCPKAPGLIRKRATSVEQRRSSSESFTPGRTMPSECSEALSMNRDEKESVIYASASSSEAESSYSSSKPRKKRFVRSRASSLSSRSRTIRTPSQTGQWCVRGNPNALFDRNYEAQKKSPAKATKPKLSIRPRSTGGKFAWDVPDVPGHSWYDETAERNKSTPVTFVERPKTANAISNRRKTPEKGRVSETVLPVLASVVDLQVELPCYGFDQVNIENDQVLQEDVKRKPSSRIHEFKRPTRSSDKRVSSESFVKSSARPVAVEQKTLPDEKSSDKANHAEPTVVVMKSSSVTKTPANRPGSVSRLPVHMGIVKTKAGGGEVVAEKPGKLFEKSLGHQERNSTSVFGKIRRPRTPGCVQYRTSSLSPKMELSLEALQLIDGPAVVAGVSAKEPETLKQEESSNHVTSDANQLKTSNRSPSLSGKRITPVPRSSINKIARSPSPRVSKDNTDSSRQGCQQDNTHTRKFLRARSGRYGAPKLDALEKEPKNSTKQEASFSSKLTVVDNQAEEKELVKLSIEESKAVLAMRRELKTYIKKIQHILSNRDKSVQAKDLASLNINEAIIPELRALLSPREIQDLQVLLDRVEKQEGCVSKTGLGALTRLH